VKLRSASTVHGELHASRGTHPSADTCAHNAIADQAVTKQAAITADTGRSAPTELTVLLFTFVVCVVTTMMASQANHQVIVTVDEKGGEVVVNAPEELKDEPPKRFTFDVVYPAGTAQVRVYTHMSRL